MISLKSNAEIIDSVKVEYKDKCFNFHLLGCGDKDADVEKIPYLYFPLDKKPYLTSIKKKYNIEPLKVVKKKSEVFDEYNLRRIIVHDSENHILMKYYTEDSIDLLLKVLKDENELYEKNKNERIKNKKEEKNKPYVPPATTNARQVPNRKRKGSAKGYGNTFSIRRY